MEAEKGNFVRFRNPHPARLAFIFIICEYPTVTYGGCLVKFIDESYRRFCIVELPGM